MTRAWAAARVPTALAAGAVLGYLTAVALAFSAGKALPLRTLLTRQGISPDKRARMDAEDAGDRFDVLETHAEPGMWWLHTVGRSTHISERGKPCVHCGAEEPT